MDNQIETDKKMCERFLTLPNVVEVRICRLRDKIDRGHNNKLIHTVRGVGYVLEEKV